VKQFECCFISGVHYVLDTTFARGFSLIESCREFVNRYKESEVTPAAFPMLASACPGELFLL
jgi:iron only hydrogenase large subunit-like protein